jgi:predicted RNA binding protein YcfA (HicA-like mRNA interferase family)
VSWCGRWNGAGWVVDRQRGSHVSLVKEGESKIVVVVMHNREMHRGLLTATIKDAGLTIDEFRRLL